MQPKGGAKPPYDRTSEKKQYDRPELLVYGDIRAITRNVGNMGKTADGGGMGNDKTS